MDLIIRFLTRSLFFFFHIWTNSITFKFLFSLTQSRERKKRSHILYKIQTTINFKEEKERSLIKKRETFFSFL